MARTLTLTTAQPPSQGGAIQRFLMAVAETLNHSFGNPREESLHQPPLVGVQPYRDRPQRRR